MENTQKKPFRGWLIVALLFLVAAGPMVWLSNFFGYFQYPVCADLGCTYAEFSLASTASTVVSVLFSALLATKVAAGKTRYWMLAGGIIGGVCLYLMGNCNNVRLIILLFGIANIGCCMYSYIPINVLIANWFVDKRGAATSIVMAGMNIGGMLFTPVVSKLIAESWRNAYHVSGLIVLIVPLIVTWFLKKPDELGQTPLMPKEVKTAEGEAQPAAAWEGATKKEALKSAAFWFYALTCLCCGMIAAGVAVQLPTFFTENGIDYASRMTIFNAAGLVGLLAMGPIIDKLGIKTGGALTGILLAASMVCLMLITKNPGMSVAAVILNPLGTCITTLGPPLLAGRLFGMKDYGGLYGLGNACFMGGCMIGPILAATIRTVSGSYNAAWIVLGIAAVVIIIGIFASIGASAKLRKQ